MNDHKFRHVCFADLEEYIKKDFYFDSYTKSEQALIRKNLGIMEREDIAEYVDNYLKIYILVTYDELCQLIENKELSTGHFYVITDFQTIYTSNTGEVWGLDSHPSYKYQIIVEALTDSLLDDNAKILSSDFTKSLLWTVKYDWNSEQLGDVSTKGKITYLEDENGNSAYFDFKSIKYELTKDFLQTNLGITTRDSVKEYKTFEASTTNVTLNKGCSNIIFFKSANDVIVNSGSSNIYVNTQIKNTTIENGTNDIVLKDSSIFNTNMHKTVYNSTDGAVLSYMDKDTLTLQTYEIDSVC